MVKYEHFYRNIKMNENGFSWIEISFFLYMKEYTFIFNITLKIYAFVKVSG